MFSGVAAAPPHLMKRAWVVAPIIRNTTFGGYRARSVSGLALLRLYRRRCSTAKCTECAACEDAIGDPGSYLHWERWEWSDWGVDYVLRRHREPVPSGFGQDVEALKRRRLAELITEERLEEVRLMLTRVVDAKWVTMAAWMGAAHVFLHLSE